MATATKNKPTSKAKTSTRRKSLKTNPVPATPQIAEIRMIPLNQLALSPKNVRKVPPSEAEDAELVASIREEGIKQNLVVYEGGKNTFLTPILDNLQDFQH